MAQRHRTGGSTSSMLELLVPSEPDGGATRPRARVSAPLLERLRGVGTEHVYADTADIQELEATLCPGPDRIVEEVDGSTVNQPLVQRVLTRYLEDSRFIGFARRFRTEAPSLTGADVAPYAYGALLGWIGTDVAHRVGGERAWEVSLQIHMGLAGNREAAITFGQTLRRLVPSCLVKVPFMPHAPQCFLVARDLERQDIPVNFTTTFSARQAITAALLANVTRTNIFMGRLNQGLRAQRLGEHTCLETQRTLREGRRTGDLKTRLIVASMREWATFAHLAGCDVFTAPCGVLSAFLAQTEVPSQALSSQLETSYADRLGVAGDVASRIGVDRIARLYRIEPELLEFLAEYRETAEFRRLTDGDQLSRRFETAGFGDVFHVPTVDEWAELRRGKLPNLESSFVDRLALDTYYSLLGHADFEQAQEAIDDAIARTLAPTSRDG